MAGTPPASRRAAPASVATRARLAKDYPRLPLSFEANRGQTDPRVKFLARGLGYTLFLTGDGAVLALRSRQSSVVSRQWEKTATDNGLLITDVVRLKLMGADHAAKIKSLGELPGKSNYFIGSDPKKWRRNVPTYAKVKFENVYPGIDLVYYGNQRQLEFDWVVAPGADPHAIRLEVETGNSKLAADPNGDLVIKAEGGEIRVHKPTAYQPANSEENSLFTIHHSQSLDVRYVLAAGNRIQLRIPKYDKSRPLIIDPVLSYSTYLSGSNDATTYGSTAINAIAVDAAGNAYVTGATTSADFPVTTGAFDTTCGADGKCGGLPLPTWLITASPPSDAFVTKLNADGSALVYSTFLGGSYWDTGNGIALDSSGDAYIAGSTNSPDFPTTPGAVQTKCGGDGACNQTSQTWVSYDAFLAKLSFDGSSLIYSTYLGGSSDDYAAGVVLDSAANAYVAGSTSSQNFPITAGAYQTQFDAACGTSSYSCTYGFVAKVNSAGSSLVYSTLLGGGDERMAGIAVDAAGNAYVTGQTQAANFPTTSGAFQETFSGGTCAFEVAAFPCPDAFLTELDPKGSSLVYSTFLGGQDADEGSAVAIDAAGNAVVVGGTKSSGFPTTAGAFQTSLKDGTCPAPLGASTTCPEAFVAKFNTANSGAASLLYSTLLGGHAADWATSLAVDASSDAYVTGITGSTDFPTLKPIEAANAGAYDVFITELNPSGNALLFSTYLGGSGGDMASGVALDSSGNIYVAGNTYGGMPPVGDGFPTTPGAFETGNHWAIISFVSKISPADAAQLTFDPSTVYFPLTQVSTTSPPQTVTLRDMGSAAISITNISTTGDFAQTNNCGAGLSGAGSCSVAVTFTPSTTSTETGQLTINDSAPGSPHVVTLIGTGSEGVPDVTVSPVTVSFGEVPLGTTASQTVTLANTGDAPLSIMNVGLTGPTEFSLSSSCPSSLSQGTHCTITVTYRPTAGGPSSGQIALSTDASGSPQFVPLSGKGVEFSLASPVTSATITAGQSATYTLTLTPRGGFDQTVKLACSGAPSQANCQVSPASVTLAGTSSSTATVTVTTTAATMLSPRFQGAPPASGSPKRLLLLFGVLALCTLAMGVVAAGLPRHISLPWKRQAFVCAGLLMMMLLWAACGGGSAPAHSPGTPPGSYSLTVSGNWTSSSSSAAISHDVKLTLTVK